jgi:hypothetical protein
MTPKKSNPKPDNSMNYQFIHRLAGELLKIEGSNLKKWQKEPELRGEELKSLAMKICPELWEANSLELILSVELDIYFQEILVSNEEMNVLMTSEEAIDAFMNFDWDTNPNTQDWIDMVTTWASDFGCLFTKGAVSPIGGWFEDPLWDVLAEIGAYEQK